MVVICFHFTIFVVLETTASRDFLSSSRLWFAFILLSLSYWKQPFGWHTLRKEVVICFHFTIFVVLETTGQGNRQENQLLWFAFILLSLSYWKQLLRRGQISRLGCDLLSFYYLCRTGNNYICELYCCWSVVICFHFTIFVVLETTLLHAFRIDALWFAFILLSLSYWKQLADDAVVLPYGCDLLSFYYLCRTGNNVQLVPACKVIVVICFHFTIFVVLETTAAGAEDKPACCDLLSFYYLCRTGNNLAHIEAIAAIVVICFHFTIFVVLETTSPNHPLM